MVSLSKNRESLLDISIEIRDLISKISKIFDQNERNSFRSHGIQGLTPPQLFLLRMLWSQEGKQEYLCKDLADISHVSRATITGVIDSMEKEGYVKREQNIDDRRSYFVKLTEKGRSLQKYKAPLNVKKMNYLQDLKPEELNKLIQLLRKLYTSIDTSPPEE